MPFSQTQRTAGRQEKRWVQRCAEAGDCPRGAGTRKRDPDGLGSSLGEGVVILVGTGQGVTNPEEVRAGGRDSQRAHSRGREQHLVI